MYVLSSSYTHVIQSVLFIHMNPCILAYLTQHTITFKVLTRTFLLCYDILYHRLRRTGSRAPQQFRSSVVRVSGEATQFEDMITISAFQFISLVGVSWGLVLSTSHFRQFRGFSDQSIFRQIFQFQYCYTVFSFYFSIEPYGKFLPNFCIFIVLLFSYYSRYQSWVDLWSFGIMSTMQHSGYRIKVLQTWYQSLQFNRVLEILKVVSSRVFGMGVQRATFMDRRL